jgi:excinuclease ABC subunit C
MKRRKSGKKGAHDRHSLFIVPQDWGPCGLEPGAAPPALRVIQGTRAELRAGTRTLCPRQPGVYGMIDEFGELIYIGKAKNLRRRLLGYFRPKGRARKAGKILADARGLAWETCPNEFAALHRELELIRRWRPKHNVQGQPRRRRFTHICLGRRPAPHVFLARRPPSCIVQFGPLPVGRQLQEAVRRLNDHFQLRDCPQKQEMIFADDAELFPGRRTPGCLRYDIGTCLAPCAALCSREAYAVRVRQARDFLTGKDTSALEALEQAMIAASAAGQFERAAGLRDKLLSLQWLATRMEQVRHMRRQGSFVYPLAGADGVVWWYLIHGGRTVAAYPALRAAGQAALIRSVYQDRKTDLLLESYEHWDAMLLVSSWFRRWPEERKRVMKPDEAVRIAAGEK